MNEITTFKENLASLSSLELLRLSFIIDSFESEYQEDKFTILLEKIRKGTSLEKKQSNILLRAEL
jgi:hypothetical protein